MSARYQIEIPIPNLEKFARIVKVNTNEISARPNSIARQSVALLTAAIPVLGENSGKQTQVLFMLLASAWNEAFRFVENRDFYNKLYGEELEGILRRRTKPVHMRIYDAWIAVLTILTLVSFYFTWSYFLPLIPGILLIVSGIATLLVFILAR